MTYLVWRVSSAGRCATTSRRGLNPTVTLTEGHGTQILASLPPATQAQWLNYESQRLELTLRLSLLGYEHYRLRDWLDRVASVRSLRAGL